MPVLRGICDTPCPTHAYTHVWVDSQDAPVRSIEAYGEESCVTWGKQPLECLARLWRCHTRLCIHCPTTCLSTWYIHNGPTAGLQAYTEVLAYPVGNMSMCGYGEGRMQPGVIATGGRGVLMDNKKRREHTLQYILDGCIQFLHHVECLHIAKLNPAPAYEVPKCGEHLPVHRGQQ